MNLRPADLTDDQIARFLRTRSADPDLGLLDAIVRTAGATPQDRPWLGPRPLTLPRRTLLLIATALLVAIMGAVAVGSRLQIEPAPPVPRVNLGVFEPIAGQIVFHEGSSLWAVDPNAPSPPRTPLRLDGEGMAGADGRFASFTLLLGWSSDGTRLLFLRQDPSDQMFPYDRYLYILHADGTETQVTSEPVADAAISPDGSRVAFSPDAGGLYVIPVSGGSPVRIAPEGASPTFSPDGSQIAYLSQPRRGCCVEGGREHVWIVNTDGTDAHEILVGEPVLAEGVFELAWSPAGDRIAMENSLDGHDAIYTFAPDGSGFTKVIADGSNAYWSPDGSQIAFMTPGRDGLRLANSDGSSIRTFDFGSSGPWHPGE